jgi:hydrogenase nickel incorporation protein HypA/HybF
MHELALADSILRIALAHADGRRVVRVDVRVGRLRQVVPSALEFAFGLVAAETEAEGAELVLEDVPAAGVCRACGGESELPAFPLRCGVCGSLDLELVRGEELHVDALEIEEDELTPIGGMAHGD